MFEPINLRPYVSISVGGGAGGLKPSPKLGRNPFHSSKISERTIENSGRKFTEGLTQCGKSG